MTPEEKFLRLRQYGTQAHVRKNILLTPLLSHFLADRARTFGVSESEYLRRILSENLDAYLKHGAYQLPDCLRTSTPIKVPRPTPSSIRNLKQYRNRPDLLPPEGA